MKFSALRSSVARLFETAATLVAPRSAPWMETDTERKRREAYETIETDRPDNLSDVLYVTSPYPEDVAASMQKAGLVVGKVTPDGFVPLPEPSIAIEPDRAVEAGKTKAEAKAAEIEKAIREAMPGVDVGVKVIGTGEDITAKILQDIVEQAKRGGIKPPPDDDFPWSTWTGMMAAEAERAPPGWAFCRIGGRKCSESGKPEDDTVEFTFGFARGSFGVWRKPFDICELVHVPDAEINESSRILTVVTHLQSGTGMGLFFDMGLAAEACDLIERSVTDLNAYDPNKAESWAPLYERIVLIWKAAGIRRAVTHAHVTGSDGETSPPIGIFERTAESMQSGRPERLS